MDNFVEMMNRKAKGLGLKQTHFVTVNGLDEEEHYTTAVELAKITDYALNIEKFKNIVGTKNYTVTINGYAKSIGNTNELLGYLDGVYGVKTGFTNGANRCLVTSIKRGNMDIISVVLGADTKKDRTRDSIKIIEYAYANYKIIDTSPNIENAFKEWKEKNNIEIVKGVNKYLSVELKESKKKIPIHNQDINNIDIMIDSLKNIEAPTQKGEKVGELKLKVSNEIRINIDIVAKDTTIKKDEKKYFIEMLSNLNRYFEKMLHLGTIHLGT